MLKGIGAELGAAFGTVIAASILVAIVATTNGSLVQVKNELATAQKDLSVTAMKQIINRCFVVSSGGQYITEEFLEKEAGKSVEKLCKFRKVSAEVEIIGGKRYTFGSRMKSYQNAEEEQNTVFVPIVSTEGQIKIGRLRVDV